MQPRLLPMSLSPAAAERLPLLLPPVTVALLYRILAVPAVVAAATPPRKPVKRTAAAGVRVLRLLKAPAAVAVPRPRRSQPRVAAAQPLPGAVLPHQPNHRSPCACSYRKFS